MKPAATNITLLPNLRLRSDQDDNVESLEHYAARLCHTACIGRTALIKLLQSTGARDPTLLSKSASHSYWIGPGGHVRRTIRQLEQATGAVDLFRGTLSSLELVINEKGLSASIGDGGRHRWCPRCVEDWDHDTSFEPLYWSVQHVKNCAIHKVRLVSNCPWCGSLQTNGAPYERRRTCRWCKRSLGSGARIEQGSAAEEWIDRQCIELVRAASAAESPFRGDTVDRFMLTLLLTKADGEGSPHPIKGHVWQFKARYAAGMRNQRLSIRKLINLSAWRGINVTDILHSPEAAASAPLIPGVVLDGARYLTKSRNTQRQERTRRVVVALTESGLSLLPSQRVIASLEGGSGALLFENCRAEVEEYKKVRGAGLEGSHRPLDVNRAYTAAFACLGRARASGLPLNLRAIIVEVAAAARVQVGLAAIACEGAQVVLDVHDGVGQRGEG